VDSENHPTSLIDGLLQYEREHLPARNLARRTRLEYHADIKQAIEFFYRTFHIMATAGIERRHLESFLAELDRRGLRGSSRRRKVASLHSFFGYLYDSGLISTDPTQRLIPSAREYSQARVLSEAEYQRLQLSCSHDVRDSAIIELVLQTGLRLSEVAAVRILDVEMPGRVSKEGLPGAIHVHGKGRKERTVTLNWKACKALQSWMALRPSNEDDHLFLSKFRAPLGNRGIQHLVTKHLTDAWRFQFVIAAAWRPPVFAPSV
jgi:site-specific recombinase XerD